MTPDGTEPMRAARRLDTERKHALVLGATDAMIEAGRHPSIAAIARRARVGRKFIYDHPELRADVEARIARSTALETSKLAAAAQVTGASLRAEVENLRAQNHRLASQVRTLEARLSRAEGARLVADELVLPGALAELADRQLAGRVAEIDHQLFDAKEELRRLGEELDAARTINRELMAESNRRRGRTDVLSASKTAPRKGER